jgi:hypothetical protein
MSTARSFWVRWSGTIAGGDGSFDSADPALRAFLRALSQEFAGQDSLGQPTVVCPGDGTLSLTAVVSAEDSGAAVNKARDAFEESISRAGGASNLPDDNHPSWRTRLIEARVRDVGRAA